MKPHKDKHKNARPTMPHKDKKKEAKKGKRKHRRDKDE